MRSPEVGPTWSPILGGWVGRRRVAALGEGRWRWKEGFLSEI
jgi:hypothetical protein